MSTAESLDELSYDLEQEGVLVRRQIDRVVVSRGAWATVMFLYEELDPTSKTGTFRAAKIAVVRFRKLRGAYRRHSAFSLASVTEARELTAVFERWFEKMDATAPAEAEERGAEREAEEDGGGDAAPEAWT